MTFTFAHFSITKCWLYQCNAEAVYTGRQFRYIPHAISYFEKQTWSTPCSCLEHSSKLTRETLLVNAVGEVNCMGFLLWKTIAVKLTAGGFSVEQSGFKGGRALKPCR